MGLNKRLISTASAAGSLDDTNPLGQATDTLEVFYNFNGNFEDVSGHDNDATNTSNGIVTSTYLEIDGVGNDFITLGRNYRIGESVSFWFQIPTNPAQNKTYFFLGQDNGNYYLWDYVSLEWDDTNSLMRLYHRARHGGGYSYKQLTIVSNFTFGEWHFVALNFAAFNSTAYSYDGSNLATVTALVGSVNGRLYDGGPYIGRVYSNGAVIYTEDAFYIDKFRIFSDELTDSQVQTLYSETPNT